MTTGSPSRASILLFLVTLVGLAGCGKVGDPLPPQLTLPPTIQDLSAERTARGNRIIFTLPNYRIESVEVYRQCDPAGSVDRLSLLARIILDELRESPQPGRFVWRDAASSGPECSYAVRFADATGLRSELSNLASPAN